MSRRPLLLLLIAGLIALTLPVNTLAGGWAVITLDELPTQFNAGEPFTVGFMVRQHGRTPMGKLSPTISARNTNSGESMVVAAEPQGEIGHYTATLTLPSAGTWNWSIQAFSMDQPMPPLSVSGGKTSIALAPKPRFPLPLILGFLGLLGTASGLWLMLQKRLRWVLALVIAGLLVSGVSFASAASRPVEPNLPTISNQTPQEIGKSLFLAKGCVTCHAHEEIKRDTNRTIFVEIGPDLTNFSADPEYLRRWLTNPAAIRPNTEMPNLQLSESEIDALIAFLNAE